MLWSLVWPAVRVLLFAAWFADPRPWFDMGCTGADIVLVCNPVFTG